MGGGLRPAFSGWFAILSHAVCVRGSVGGTQRERGERVRLDKYLQVARLVRRRALAQEFIAGGRVSVAGRAAKPSTEVRVGDELTLQYGTRTLTVRVLAVPERAPSGRATEDLYEVVGETRRTDER